MEEKTGIIRDEQGKFVEGVSGNPKGRPPETPEEKAIKKATKELIEDYKEKLAEALPKISPVLIAKAIAGDIGAIKEINDRVMGKAKQPVEVESERGITIIFKDPPNGNKRDRTDDNIPEESGGIPEQNE